MSTGDASKIDAAPVAMAVGAAASASDKHKLKHAQEEQGEMDADKRQARRCAKKNRQACAIAQASGRRAAYRARRPPHQRRHAKRNKEVKAAKKSQGDVVVKERNVVLHLKWPALLENGRREQGMAAMRRMMRPVQAIAEQAITNVNAKSFARYWLLPSLSTRTHAPVCLYKRQLRHDDLQKPLHRRPEQLIFRIFARQVLFLYARDSSLPLANSLKTTIQPNVLPKSPKKPKANSHLPSTPTTPVQLKWQMHALFTNSSG